MLINDDVIVRTRGWDSAVYRAFARYADDLALVHVNDLLFGQRLCTFPILSRKSCLEIGICPQCYRRYRIDDHIYDSYGLLGYLGHSRLVYLKDVIFEHENYSVAGSRTGRRAGLPAREERLYVPNAEVFEADSRDFENCFEDRKKDARKLARLIETAALENRQATYERVLANVRDPHGCRRYFVALGRRSAAGWPARIALGMESKLAAIVNGRPCAARTGRSSRKGHFGVARATSDCPRRFTRSATHRRTC